MKFTYKKFLIFILTLSLIVSSTCLTSLSVLAEDLNTAQPIEITTSAETESETTDIESSDSEFAESESSYPESKDPESTESENTNSESTDSEIATSESTTPESTDSENMGTEDPESENTDSEDADLEDSDSRDFSLENYYTIQKTLNVKLKYDDRYTLDTALTNYQLLTTEDETITSHVVSGGKVLTKLDEHILTLKNNTPKKYIASAVGTADLIFVTPEDAKLIKSYIASQNQTPDTNLKNPDKENPATETAVFDKVPAIKLHVCVEPAVLTLMYLAGQSNMEGVCGRWNYQPKNSIACTAGTVYSTFGYKTDDRGSSITGLTLTNHVTSSNASDFTPESLTSNTSVSGVHLQYPLNSLTTEGSGKTGPDSGIAYEWNRLTNHKVWTVNCAHGGSAIANWAIGGNCYTKASNLFAQVSKVYSAELAAGHYLQGEKLFFWMQGEADTTTPVADIRNSFLSMHDGFKNVCQFSHFGIITTRSSNDHTTNKSIEMVPPRITQYYYGGKNGLDDVYIVSNDNEKWTDDTYIKTYFSKRYPSGHFTYPKRKGNCLTELPSQVSDVHPDIHFTQEAHNENGISAANSMYKILRGKTSSTSPYIKWIDDKGNTVTTLKITVDDKRICIPAIYPGYCAKNLTFSTSSGVSYSPKTGYIKLTTSGTKKIQIKDASGTILNTLTVTAVTLTAPKITNLKNAANGVSVTWNAVNGASKYRVFRKNGSGWTKLVDTTETNYIDQTAVSGSTNTYTVRCINTSGDSYTSSYDKNGWSIHYLASPKISSVKNVTAGVNLKWKTVKKATQYIIYRKTGSEAFKRLTTIYNGATTFFTDQTALHGKLYTYKILACNNLAKSAYSSPYPLMFRMKTPALKSIKNNKAGTVTMTYATDSHVTGYQYFYKDPVSGQSIKGTISNNSTASISVKNLKKWKTYDFYFRTYRKTGGTTYYSSWSNPYTIKITQ